jgi:putative salt-induced outer membrane protein YdiY
VALLVGCASAAFADTISLRSGERLVGKVIAEEAGKVIFESQALGRVEVPRERIERIERDAAPPAQPFTPPPPPGAKSTAAPPGPTNALAAAAASTNAAPKHRWFWQRKRPADEANVAWIQLKSGEWLRGRLYGMQNRKLEFESDELDELIFDWKDIHQVVAPRALVSYGDRQNAWGSLYVDRENVTVKGAEEVRFPRYDLVGIASGSPRELDYWSGKFNVGLNLRAGNTEQADLVTKIKLERRTPDTHLRLDYVGNYGAVNKVENVNNQRATGFFDIFLTRRLFVRVPYAEYYSDPFQNIGRRLTIGGGMGYYLIDRPKVEWLISGGPAYQFIRFDTVEADDRQEHSTPAFALQSSLDIELTKQIDLEVGYQAIAANENSGGITHHGTITLEIDLTRRIDLDVSFIWDRIGSPQGDSSGLVPKKDDFRLNLSFGVKF